MRRRRLIGVLRLAVRLLEAALALTFAVLPHSSERADAAVARMEVRRAGPYVLDIALDTASPHVERPLGITVRALPGSPKLEDVALTVTGLPGAGTDATPTRARRLRADPRDPGSYTGELSFAVSGAWALEVRVAGSAGTGAVKVPITVAAPPRDPRVGRVDDRALPAAGDRVVRLVEPRLPAPAPRGGRGTVDAIAFSGVQEIRQKVDGDEHQCDICFQVVMGAWRMERDGCGEIRHR